MAGTTLNNAVILAGGFGTRLADHVPGVPKTLAPIAGRPFLDYQIDWLEREGVKDIAIAAFHMAEQIDAFVRTRSDRKITLQVIREDMPLGTGGAVKNALTQAGYGATALVLNGDTAFDFELLPLIDAHRNLEAMFTLAVFRVEDVARFGTVSMDGSAVTSFKQASGKQVPGLVSAGAYILEPSAIAAWPGTVFSLETDLLPAFASEGELNGFVMEDEHMFHDIGTPASYDSFCQKSTTDQ